MKISIITPVCESGKKFGSTLQSIIGQIYENYELIVVDHGTSHGLRRDVLTANINSSYYELDGGGSCGEALHLGMQKADGDIICFVHPGERLADENTLQLVSNAFKKHKVNVVYGKGTLNKGKDIFSTLRRFGTRSHRNRHESSGTIPLHTTIYMKREMLESREYILRNGRHCEEYEFFLHLFMDPIVQPYFLDEFVLKVFLKEEKEHVKSSRRNRQEGTQGIIIVRESL